MSDELLLLKDVCAEYFSLTERGAKAKASNGLLPVPAFRIAGTRRGPYDGVGEAGRAYLAASKSSLSLLPLLEPNQY